MLKIKSLLLMFLLLTAMTWVHALEITEGIEYETLDNPQPVSTTDKIEVIEFFSYACPHCYNLEPEVVAWLKNKPENIHFIQVPAIFNKQWEAFARVFYTAEVLGVKDKVHQQIFDAIHGPGKKIRSLDDLKAIFVANGVDAKVFEQTLSSFSVATKVRQAKAKTKSYGVDSVPMIIVQGKYRTSSSLAHGHKNVFKVVEYIIKHEKLGAQ